MTGNDNVARQTELFWDLSRSATRACLLDQTMACLDEASRCEVKNEADAAGIPDRHHHDFGEVLSTIDGLAVSDEVRSDMAGVYRLLAEAEAAAHGCSVEQTHFHEVGNGSALRNTLLICLAIRRLSPKRIMATPVQTGSGFVQCAHGTLPIPAPATAALIARGLPVQTELEEGELLTPTSAALVLHFVDEFR